ncbi:MAG: hypothetical protein WCJ87_03320 [Burkholderiales bacterium]
MVKITDVDNSDKPSMPQSVNNESIQASRRRLLLNGMVKGSAIAASAAPIKTLAFTSAVTAGGQICSASGVQSMAHSKATGLPTCRGRPPGYFKTLSNWPGYSAPDATCTVGSVTFTQNSTFGAVFGPGSTRVASTLVSILTDYTSSDEAFWIAALLNSIMPLGTAVFPYTPSEVLALYSSPQKSSATDLFRIINSY